MAQQTQQEELERIEVVTASEQDAPQAFDPQAFLKKYQNLLLAGLVALGGAAYGIYYYFDYSQVRETESREQLAGPFNFFEKDSLNKAVKGTAQMPGLEKYVEDYGNTKAGAQARLMLASAYLEQGKTDQAIEQLEKLQKGNNYVSASALLALGGAYEEKGRWEDAAKTYLKASEIGDNNQTKPFFLKEAGRCYEEAKDNKRALEVYKQLKEKYPLSEEGRSIDKYLARLGG